MLIFVLFFLIFLESVLAAVNVRHCAVRHWVVSLQDVWINKKKTKKKGTFTLELF